LAAAKILPLAKRTSSGLMLSCDAARPASFSRIRTAARSKFSLKVMNELKTRGVADILIAWYIGADAENCGSVS
jgi:hypothetical protein